MEEKTLDEKALDEKALDEKALDENWAHDVTQTNKAVNYNSTVNPPLAVQYTSISASKFEPAIGPNKSRDLFEQIT